MSKAKYNVHGYAHFLSPSPSSSSLESPGSDPEDPGVETLPFFRRFFGLESEEADFFSLQREHGME